MKTEKLDGISIEEINVNATPGTTIERAIEDAMILSINEMVIVKVRHNSTVFTVDPWSMRKTVSSSEVV